MNYEAVKNLDDVLNTFGQRQVPTRLIVGTDWWTDVDDVVAMRVLAWGQKDNLVDVLGFGINACMNISVSSFSAFMTAEGYPDIPIGLDRKATDYDGEAPYQRRMINHPHSQTNLNCEDAVSMYRRLLANADEKVDIIEIGYPNILSGLLQSEADTYSSLSGIELVRQKVNKLWMMAGNWEHLTGGVENNFIRNNRSRKAGSYVCENWPTEITFLGFEVGVSILSGETLTSEKDMLRNALYDHGLESGRNGRSSWDPMTILLAIYDDEKAAGYKTVRGKAAVDAQTGSNTFTIAEDGKHQYVITDNSDDYYKNIINKILESREQK